jgi:hypothetical protein
MKVLLIETSGEENASITTVIKSKDPVATSDPVRHFDKAIYQSPKPATAFPKAAVIFAFSKLLPEYVSPGWYLDSDRVAIFRENPHAGGSRTAHGRARGEGSEGIGCGIYGMVDFLG